MSWKHLFSRALEAGGERLHFAAHSHHLWPDATFAAQMSAWIDAARQADRKWDHVFGTLIPRMQQRLAGILGLPDPASLVFGPNTHAFLLRILSCLPSGRPARVLSTDGEFHSFARQSARLEEAGSLAVRRIPCEPFATFPERLAAAAREGGHDLVYVSHVFFNSGYAVPDIAALVAAVPDPRTLVAVDGYHAVMARPVDLAPIASRAFYLGGGYKYMMAGEGACFLHCPPGAAPRPPDTGWLAAFGALEGRQDGRVPYGADASRFLGATFDPSGLHRMAAVLELIEREGITPAALHAHAHRLQARFIAGLAARPALGLSPPQLVVPLSEPSRGNFLTFRTPDAGAIQARLLAADIVTDHRDDRLRFGFGPYHDDSDVDRLLERMQRM
jgi:selenocysteine lyase/cysteine desulfurase